MSSPEDFLAVSRRRGHDVVGWITRQVTTAPAQLFLVLAVASSAALASGQLDEGWYPHDDGSFAHSAERVLDGELPHRDFADLYTGLLTFVNAGVFLVLDHDLLNLRLPLLALFLVYVACFFAIARRLVSPVWAFIASLFAAVWSVPVFPVPVSSWYVIFLWTIGTYAVIRGFETDRKRWFLAAGACGGISIAIKVVGVWYCTAAVLALLARRLRERRNPESDRETVQLYPALVILSAVAAFAIAAGVILARPESGEIAAILLPIAAVCGAIVITGARAARRRQDRGGQAVFDVAVFIGGASVPLLLFAIPYAITGSLGTLLEGVLLTPRSRLEFASWSMPTAASLLWAIPVVALFAVRATLSTSRRRFLDVAAMATVVALLLTASSEASYSILWETTRALAPFVVVAGALAIVRRRRTDDVPGDVVCLVVLVAGFALAVQFPFGSPIYFVYAAPFVLLAAVAALRSLGIADGLLPGTLLVALVIFGFSQLDHQSVKSLGTTSETESLPVVLKTDRASVRVSTQTKREYDVVLRLVAAHNPGGGPIFAGPDSPEIYFLTRSKNPTRSIMDFLDDSNSTRGERLIALLRKRTIPIVVLNRVPEQSPPLSRQTMTRIRSMYANRQSTSRFDVLWGRINRSQQVAAPSS